jgi:hypothetical protein
MTPRYRVAITMVVGCILIIAVLVKVMTQAPREVLATNHIGAEGPLGFFPREHAVVCQASERLPAATDAVRLSLLAYIGSAVFLTVSHEGHIVASGQHGAGWVSSSLTIALHPPIATTLNAKICLTRDPRGLPVELVGNNTSAALAATINGKPLAGRLRTEYLGRGHRSWLSLAKHVARRLGLGHPLASTWIVLPLALMMAIATALGALLLLREARYE